jgi:hypothetical protein
MRSAVRSHKRLLTALLSANAKTIRQGVDDHLVPDAVIPPSIAE